MNHIYRISSQQGLDKSKCLLIIKDFTMKNRSVMDQSRLYSLSFTKRLACLNQNLSLFKMNT